MKAKPTCLFLGIFLLFGLANSTEIPAGPVSGDWYSTGNPYNINGEIYVDVGNTLNIHEGVQVIFQGHYKFIVYGYLEAIGTDPDPISFSAAEMVTGWHGIRFLNAPDNSHLTYCFIQYGRATGTEPDYHGGGIYCDSSDPVISHCSFYDCSAGASGGGIGCTYGASPQILNCTFENCAAYGGGGEGGGGIACGYSANPIIDTCNFMGNSANNLAGGIGSAYGANPTISNCTLNGNTAVAGGGLGIYQSSPTINNCYITENSASLFGGGIYCEDGANADISGCIISGNDAVITGGGISCDVASSLILTDCSIDSNYAGTYGGGIMCDGLSDATIQNCAFNYNVADSSGGAIASNDASPQILDCTIMNNIVPLTSDLGGGGIACAYGTPLIGSCIIEGNTGGFLGGGIGLLETNAIIEYCDVIGNIACDGGGFAVFYCSPVIRNCTITNNSATNFDGGGLDINYSGSYPIIENCTISKNLANRYGSQIDVYGGASANVSNTIIAGSTPNPIVYFYQSPDVVLNYCDFYNNIGENFSGTVPTGLGVITGVNINGDPCDDYMNIFEDPEFIYPVQDDYRLSWGSACIDAGTGMDPDATLCDMGFCCFDQSMQIRAIMSPFDMPIEIPPAGGSFDFAVHLTNIAPVALTIDAWIDVTLPSGGTYGPVLGPLNLELGSEFTLTRIRDQVVPANAPPGMYSYNVFAVYESDTTSDSFNFTKLGEGDMNVMGGWLNTGESFEEYILELNSPVPVSYALHQNYPNPFNPITTIAYVLPEKSHVNLTVYNMLGREVSVLVDGFRNSGFQEVIFDASNLSSGIYLYRLQAGDFNATGKMVLMK